MPDAWEHDPDETIDYARDWRTAGDLAADDTIVTSTWTPHADNVDTELAVASDSHTDTVATVRVGGGGTVGERYGFTNHIVTAAGLEFDHTLWFVIGEK